MIVETVKRSILADYADRFAAASAAGQGEIAIREVPFLTQFNLRANPSGVALMERLRRALGFPLPVAPNTVSSLGERRALWLGPDEWLLVGPEGQQGAIESALRASLAGEFGSIVDVSANRTLFKIAGAMAGDLLAHGCSIDLHPRSFTTGRCAQTLLAKAQVILERRDGEATYHLFVRTSFAGYVAGWLLDAIPDIRR